METKETMTTEQNILKYLQVLRELKVILDSTPHLSMMNFSEKHNASKNLSTVLQKGGVIELTKRGRHPEWKWISIEPNRMTALKTLQELSALNPTRKYTPRKEKAMVNETVAFNGKEVDYYELKIFFGLITVRLNPVLKNK